MARGGFNWQRYLGWDTRQPRGRIDRQYDWSRGERQRLLPRYHNENLESAIPAREVTKVALRLRHLIEECVPCEMEEASITRAHSKIITRKVVQAAIEAGGHDYGACVVFCLLVCKRWFKHQGLIELWNAELHAVRAVACEVIAKQIIEGEENLEYLLHNILLTRYSIMVDNEPIPAANVIEKAVDLHALRVIGSSGYQKCISYLWRGWLIQDENDPAKFVDYAKKDSQNYFAHMDPDRMRAPRYQNAAQVLISILYLGLFTIVISSVNPKGDLGSAETALYIFTAGFVCDEFLKFWKAGYQILGFWNAFNFTLYSFLTTSLILRLVGFSHPVDDPSGLRQRFNHLSYNFLAFSTPMFWMRLLLYLDSFRFFGTMLVVLKVMMKESLIFFALLVVVVVGFLQAFLGMDLAQDQVIDDTAFILQSMANAVMQSPNFDGFDNFSPPFGIVLYYIFTFVVMVILLNILIALYNSSYEAIYDNADEEFLALLAQKTMLFVRAPDENVYIPPFNLIEIVVAGAFEWWLPKPKYEYLNDWIMGIIYSPLLLIAAYIETRAAADIARNRSRGEADDDTVEEWEQMENEVDFEAEGWAKKVQSVKSNVEDEQCVIEVRKLQAEVEELKMMLLEVGKAIGVSTGASEGGSSEAKGKQSTEG